MKYSNISQLKFLLYLTLIFNSPIIYAQLSSKDIENLKQQAIENRWTFEIGETSATKRPLNALLGYIPPDPSLIKQVYSEEESLKPIEKLPTRWDWREKVPGGLPPVRDQGSCGSCWAFATVGALECAIKIKDGINVDLSEQWLVDCATGLFWYGCDGGIAAHDWHQGTRTDSCGGYGAVLEKDYPYLETQNNCACPVPHYYTIRAWHYVGPMLGVPPIDSIKTAIYRYGPIVCAMETKTSFLAYKGGLYNDNTDSKATPNHMVVIVGWDDNYGNGAFIIRNSWGESWGENGYGYIEYGTAQIGYAANYIEYGEPFDPLSITPTSDLIFYTSSNNYKIPSSISIRLENTGDTNLSWSAGCEPTLQISPTSGSLYPGQSTNLQLTVLQSPTEPGTYQKLVSIINNSTQKTTNLTVKIKRATSAPVTFKLDTDPGWDRTGDWEFGVPLGTGGDPSSGYTGGNVFGHNLAGTYENNMDEEYLISNPIDCSTIKNTQLRFYRWLGIENSSYDHARIDISSNGSNWSTIWEHTGGTLQETQWNLQTINISYYADQSPMILIRWVMGPTDSSVTYSGWNIDDISITGDPVYTAVPYLINKPLSEAQSLLTNSNLTIGEVSFICSNQYPTNIVMSQNPTPGTLVPIGSAVNLTVSTGPCYVSVPDVYNKTIQEAEIILTNAGLVSGNIEYSCSDTINPNHVISQDPPTGTQVPLQSPVHLLISTGPCAPEGDPEGSTEGTEDGSFDGTMEGTNEGNGITEGVIEGTTEGSSDGMPEGISDGEATPEGTLEGSGEGNIIEGFNEGTNEGLIDGIYEGNFEGIPDGASEGEGNTTEGYTEEGYIEGEGTPEVNEGIQEGVSNEGIDGEFQEGINEVAEGELAVQYHSADIDKDYRFSLSEVLRVIQLYNMLGYHCGDLTEDGFLPGPGTNHDCIPHSSDYNPQDWKINLQELLRLIQFYNIGTYYSCPGESEDNFCLRLTSM